MSFSDLPHFAASEKSPYICKPDCVCEIPEEPVVDNLEEDKRLANWKKWLRMRKIAHKILGQTLHRSPGDLLMNAYEDYRSTKEEKLVFEYTNIPEPDPDRGCPYIWEKPISLYNKCHPKEAGPYYAHISKERKCEIPEITYVKVPRAIKKEKGFYPKQREGYENWSNSVYRHERFVTLIDKIRKVEPHKPMIDDLMLQGTPITKTCKRETVTDEENDLEVEDILTLEENEFNTIFVINYTPLYKNQTGSAVIRLIFDFDIEKNSILTRTIKLENKTEIAVRYHFKLCPKSEMFKEYMDEDPTYNQVFHFNKNEQISVPGTLSFFKFFFYTKNIGSYEENWEMILKPNIFPNLKIIMALKGFADYSKKPDALNKIKDKIKRSRHSLVEGTFKLKDINRYEPITYTYNKKDIFEAMNSHFDPYNKNYKYEYNKEVVDELEHFYKKIRLTTHPEVWNLNILDLRGMTKEREIVDYEVFKVNVAEKYNADKDKEYLDIQKNILEGCEIKTTCDRKKETKSMPTEATIVEAVENLNIPKPNKYSEELEAIIEKLKKPVIHPAVDQEKYAFVYFILSVHIDKLCEEIEDLKFKMKITEISNYPILKEQTYNIDRFILEEKKDAYRKNMNDIRFYPLKGETKKPEFLNDIPLEDYNKRYKLYFNISDEEEGKGKKKKGKKKKNKSPKKQKKGKKDKSEKSSKKKNKSDKSSKKGKKKKKGDSASKPSEPEDPYIVNEHFYPFQEFPTEVSVSSKDNANSEIDIDDPTIESKSSVEETSAGIIYQYRYNLYLLFYGMVENLIQAVGEYLDNFECIMPLPQVQEIERCNECGMHFKYKKIPKLNLIDLRYIVSSEEIKKNCFAKERSSYDIEIKESQPLYGIDSQDQIQSLFSILQPYQSNKESDKPISYPEENVNCRDPRYSAFMNATFDVYTETPDGIVDPNWSRFKDKEAQTVQTALSRRELETVSDNFEEDEYSENQEDQEELESTAEDIIRYCERNEEESVNEGGHLIKIKKRRKVQLDVEESVPYHPEFCSDDPVFYDDD